MCGIAGIVSSAPVDPETVRAMTVLMAHRGPDGEGLWQSRDECCVLGHRRLAILDLSEAGRQPMLRGPLAITYNGEIYNFVELRERLAGLGHAFTSRSDTEVLLAAYEQWGADCVRELNGMFAFAIWDASRAVLFCARDRFGEKPFVYSLVGGTFAFGSEAKAVALWDEVDLDIDDGVLASYVLDGSTRIDAGERTLLRGVQQLLPAHTMEVALGPGGASIRRTVRYWSVDLETREPYGSREADAAGGELLELLSDSVRIRLRSDVPVGSCLSGGLDSSTVVSLIRRLEPRADLRTFTGRFPGDPLDEGRYASLVVAASRTVPFEVAPTPERFMHDAARLYWHADFPIGGMSQFAQWCVFHLASENGVTVLLDGQGADELLGGYGNRIVEAFLAQLRAEHRARAYLFERAAAARSNPARFSWPRLVLNAPAARPLRRLVRRAAGRAALTPADLVRERWLAEAALERPAPLAEESLPAEHALSLELWRLSFRTMLSALLRFGDRLSMAHSREVRLPFCDHRVAELAFRVPPDLIVGNRGQARAAAGHPRPRPAADRHATEAGLPAAAGDVARRTARRMGPRPRPRAGPAGRARRAADDRHARHGRPSAAAP
jgi:asparagine synthase (glutamine-hydrolysing)